jgi:hypothetical protein
MNGWPGGMGGVPGSIFPPGMLPQPPPHNQHPPFGGAFAGGAFTGGQPPSGNITLGDPNGSSGPAQGQGQGQGGFPGIGGFEFGNMGMGVSGRGGSSSVSDGTLGFPQHHQHRQQQPPQQPPPPLGMRGLYPGPQDPGGSAGGGDDGGLAPPGLSQGMPPGLPPGVPPPGMHPQAYAEMVQRQRMQTMQFIYPSQQAQLQATRPLSGTGNGMDLVHQSSSPSQQPPQPNAGAHLLSMLQNASPSLQRDGAGGGALAGLFAPGDAAGLVHHPVRPLPPGLGGSSDQQSVDVSDLERMMTGTDNNRGGVDGVNGGVVSGSIAQAPPAGAAKPTAAEEPSPPKKEAVKWEPKRTTSEQPGRLRLQMGQVPRNSRHSDRGLDHAIQGSRFAVVRPRWRMNVVWELPSATLLKLVHGKRESGKPKPKLVVGLMRLGMATNKVSIVNKGVVLNDNEWRQLDQMQRQFDHQRSEGRLPPDGPEPVAKKSIEFHAPRSAGLFVYRMFDEQDSVQTLATSIPFIVDVQGRDVDQNIKYIKDLMQTSKTIHSSVSQLAHVLKYLVELPPGGGGVAGGGGHHRARGGSGRDDTLGDLCATTWKVRQEGGGSEAARCVLVETAPAPA